MPKQQDWLDFCTTHESMMRGLDADGRTVCYAAVEGLACVFVSMKLDFDHKPSKPPSPHYCVDPATHGA